MISVVIPSYGRPRSLQNALASVRAGSRYPTEIIVLSPQAGEEYSAICGAAGAVLRDDHSREDGRRVKSLWQVLNEGIEAASGSFVCWLNDDCTVLRDWDFHALRYFEKPDCGLVTLRTRHADGGPDFVIIPTLYGIPCANYGLLRKADGLRFDERFSWFHGDADIALQAHFLSRKRVYPTEEPCVVHEHIGDALRSSNERDEATRRDWIYLNAKWRGHCMVGPLRVYGIAARTINAGSFLASRFARLAEKLRAWKPA